jgi:hypothetical protein
MEEWFFLDGIHCFSTDLPVCQCKEGPMLVMPNAADTAFALLDGAAVIAE